MSLSFSLREFFVRAISSGLCFLVIPCCQKNLETSSELVSSPSSSCSIPSRFYADIVTQANLLPTATADARLAANGVRGSGEFSGSTDVFSLDQAKDGEIILAWTVGKVKNCPGPDLVVFENAFGGGSGGSVYFEPVIVSVSEDGANFVDFPHHYKGKVLGGARDKTKEPGSRSKEDWIGFAGMRPVHFHEENAGVVQCLDPLDNVRAGGDPFDLDDLSSGPHTEKLKLSGFRFVKLTAPPVRDNPETCDALGKGCKKYPRIRSGYADIDGVYAKCF